MADAAAAADRFAERFGRPPEGVWAAPGRVNLIGEHTDYNDGFVLPFAIDLRVEVAAARRADGRLRVVSEALGEASVALDEIGPGRPDGWAAYPAGVLWSLAQEGVAVGGLDLLVASNVPPGAGLSSSAALECGVLLAARDLYGGPDDPKTLALAAQNAENQVVGVPCGVMDQLAAMMGAAGRALLVDCRSLEVERVPFDPEAAGLAVLVVDTRVAHSLAGGEYADRRAGCRRAAEALGVAALRDATPEQVGAARDRLDGDDLRLARHVVGENERVLAAAALLREGRVGAVGSLLVASHRSLRDDYRVSGPELDAAMEAAMAGGAAGARMTGAGFGGSVVALVPAGNVATVTAAVEAAFAGRGWRPPVTFTTGPADGATRLA